MNRCPGPEELEEFLEERHDEARQETLAAHIGQLEDRLDRRPVVSEPPRTAVVEVPAPPPASSPFA